MKMKHYLIIFILFADCLNAYQIINTTRAGAISAFTGIADDASSIYYNPAGSSYINNHEIYMFSSDIYDFDITHNQILYSMPIYKNLGLGVGYAGTDFKDNELSFSQDNFIFNFSGKLFKNLSCGFNYKTFSVDADYLSIIKNKGTSNSYDAGALFFKNNFKAGILFANINEPDIKYSDGVKTGFEESYVRLGVSYSFDKLLFGADYDDRKILYFGGEYRVLPNIIHIFGGLKKQFSPDDSIRYSFGLRFSVKDLFIDYSNDLNSDLGNTHKFAVGYKFGFKNFVKLRNNNDAVMFFPHLKNIYANHDNKYTEFMIVNSSDKTLDIGMEIINNKFIDMPNKKQVNFKPYEEKIVCLPINFNDKIFEINDFASEQFMINFYYRINNREYIDSEKFAAVIFNKNSFLWNEPEKIGNFITPKSFSVVKFNNVLFERIKIENLSLPLPENINRGIILFDSLKMIGMQYKKDSIYPYNGFDDEQKLLDFVQYPAQTLELKNGDCDDFSVLFASLFLNLGINVKLIIHQEHIYIAFDSGIKNIREFEYLKNKLMHIDGEYYVPVEVSALNESFIHAWMIGMENLSESDYFVIDVKKIWEKYPPLNLKDNFNPDMPFIENLISEFNYEYYEFTKTFINTSGKIENKTGSEIKKIADDLIEKKDYFQALNYYLFLFHNDKRNAAHINNIANLYYLINNYQKSIDFYLMASELDKDNPYYFAQISLLYYKLNENYKAEYYYNKTVSIEKKYFDKYIDSLQFWNNSR